MIAPNCKIFNKLEFLTFWLLKYKSYIKLIVLSIGTKIIKVTFILIDAPILKLMFAF